MTWPSENVLPVGLNRMHEKIVFAHKYAEFGVRLTTEP